MDDAPRVLMVSERFSPVVGGLERQGEALARELIRRGLGVEVVTRRFSGLAGRESLGGLSVCRLAGLHAMGPGRPAFLLGQASFLAATLSYLARHSRRFDVMHVLGLSPYAGPLAVAAHTLGLRTVVKIASPGVGEAGVRGRRLAWLRRRLMRHFDAVVAVSEQIASALEDDGVRPDRIVRLPNFVDTDRFKPVSRAERVNLRRALWPDWPDEALVVLFLNRLQSSKGLDVLLRAAARLDAAPAFRVAVAGDGPERQRLEALSRELGLAGTVRFFGTVSSPDRYCAASDIFALPTAYEGMPNSLLEALAAGLPVAASRVPGVTGVVTDESARLVVPGRVDDWVTVLQELLRSVEQRQRMGLCARHVALSRFSLSGVVDAYCEMYRRLTRPRDHALAQGVR